MIAPEPDGLLADERLVSAQRLCLDERVREFLEDRGDWNWIYDGCDPVWEDWIWTQICLWNPRHVVIITPRRPVSMTEEI